MTGGRLILILIVAGVCLWLWKHSAQNMMGTAETGGVAPIARARTAAARSNADTAATSAAQSAADSGPAAGVTENMTPDQVRNLLGSPSDTRSETLDTGVVRETWTYSQVNKTVVFENGIVVSIR